MKTMWAPWRADYIHTPKTDGCIFCTAVDGHDSMTLYNGEATLVVMNRFPYANGHLLVAPRLHVAELDQLEPEASASLFETVKHAVRILKKQMNPDGFNVGLNLGKVAGAGIAEHLHFHIVPRWWGDTNLLTVLADVRIVSEHLHVTFEKLKPDFGLLHPSIGPMGDSI